MKKLKALLLAIGLLAGSPVLADPITMQDGFSVQSGKVGLTSDKIEMRSSGGTGKATIKFTDSSSNTPVYTWPDVTTGAAPVMTEGSQTINGAKTFSTAPTITGGLTAANIQSGSAKRELLRWTFAQNIATQTCADSTVYSARLFPGRAGVVKAIFFGCKTAPTVGTDTLKVLKGSSSGNTMLSAATFDANTLVADTASAATLTSTTADLALTATQPIYVEYSAGSQTVDAVDLSVTIEYEPTDF